MKTKFAVMFFTISVMCLATCMAFNYDDTKGSGNIKTETRDLKGFKGIDNYSPADIVLKKGNTFEVKLEADDNILPLITTEVNGDVLEIKMKKGFSFRNIKVKAFIQMPEVNKLAVHGSGSITSDDKFEGNELTTQVHGSGDIKLKFSGKKIDISIDGSGNTDISGDVEEMQAGTHGSGDINLNSNGKKLDLSIDGSGDIAINGNINEVHAGVHGSGDITMNGSSDNTEIQLDGSGDFNGNKLSTKTATVTINGSGDCNLNVSSKISGSIHGSGNVHYKGDATVVDLKRQGSGNIIKD